jgi:hypothetical protein
MVETQRKPAKGYRVLLHCPLCLKEVLTVEEARLLMNLLHRGLLGEAEAFLDVRGLLLFIVEPRSTDRKQLLNNRIAVGSLCNAHKQVDSERIEQVLVFAGVYGHVERERL